VIRTNAKDALVLTLAIPRIVFLFSRSWNIDTRYDIYEEEDLEKVVENTQKESQKTGRNRRVLLSSTE
jgi:hypothetical protein